MIELTESAELEQTTSAQIIKRQEKHGVIITNFIFRTYGYIHSASEEKDYIVEPIRNTEDNIMNLIEKLKRMELTLKCVEKCNLELMKKPTVLIVAEDKTQMKEVMNALRKKRYRNFELAFSYDRLMFECVRNEERIVYYDRKSFWQKFCPEKMKKEMVDARNVNPATVE